MPPCRTAPSSLIHVACQEDPPHGKKVVKLTYFDDAGLFNAKQERYIVIGGCIVDGDSQLVTLESEISRLVEKYIPEDHRAGFVFHATELWSGGKYFNRDNWSFTRRLEILRDLVAIPRKLAIPLVFGFQDRAGAQSLPPDPKWGDQNLELILYAHTYARFAETVERFMRKLWPDENTILIGEDNDAVRKMTKAAHNLYRNPAWVRSTNSQLLFFPFQRIREGVHFSPKHESAPLQLADIVTFFVKKRLMHDPNAGEFYSKLTDSLLVLPKEPNR